MPGPSASVRALSGPLGSTAADFRARHASGDSSRTGRTATRGARRREGPPQSTQDVARLLLDRRVIERKRRVDASLGRDSLLEVAGEMARREHEIARARGGRVARQWLRDTRHGDVDPRHGRSIAGSRPGIHSNSLIGLGAPRYHWTDDDRRFAPQDPALAA